MESGWEWNVKNSGTKHKYSVENVFYCYDVDFRAGICRFIIDIAYFDANFSFIDFFLEYLWFCCCSFIFSFNFKRYLNVWASLEKRIKYLMQCFWCLIDVDFSGNIKKKVKAEEKKNYGSHEKYLCVNLLKVIWVV